MCEEAKDSGIKTLVMLDDQGEQLEKFEKGVDGINADMRLAEEALKSMDLLCGIFPKFWKKSGGFKEDDAIWGDQKVRKKIVSLEGFPDVQPVNSGLDRFWDWLRPKCIGEFFLPWEGKAFRLCW